VKQMLALSLVLSALGFVACGDDDGDSERDGGGQDGGTAGKGGGGGKGGRAGGAGAAGGGMTMGGAVKCGSTMCEAPAGAMGFISACCADEAKGTCGMTSLMGGQCSVPAKADPRCPTVSAMGFMIPSCCTPQGMCGLDASMFGFGGCTDLDSAAKQAGAMGGGASTIPAPRRCDEADGGADADAGL
jgi:hypothetical protein